MINIYLLRIEDKYRGTRLLINNYQYPRN